MNVKLVLGAVVSAAAGLLLAGSASAQSSDIVKVSNAVEGNPIPGMSVARCGTNIVVGFADAEGAPAGSTTVGPGFAVSKDGGKTFSDLGVLSDFGFGGGDSIVGCSSSSTFYYATLWQIQTADGSCVVGCTEIAVSTSINGGFSWKAPIAASAGTLDNYQFSAPTFAVDPANPKRMYVAYLNFNGAPNDFSDCGGEPNSIILEFVTSSDGGNTWSGRSDPAERGTPSMQLDHACPAGGLDPARNGSLSSPSVLVGPGGAVYLTYAFTGYNPNTGLFTGNEIRFLRSLDAGTTFSMPVKISTQAINNAAPHLTVDRTNSRHRGEIFVTWSGAPTGTYTDVLVSDSLDGGLSFSFPRPVSPAPAAGAGRFQTNPVLAVDNDGQVKDCFYATPTNSPTSSSVYSYNCATSFNHAASWAAQRVVSSAPVGFDAVTSDFLLHNEGFFTAFELQASDGERHVVGEKSDNP